MRYDDWSSLLQALISSIAGLHPAARWLGNRSISSVRRPATITSSHARARCGPTQVVWRRSLRWRGSIGSRIPCSPLRRRARDPRCTCACCGCSMPAGVEARVERRTAVGAACAFSLAVCGASHVAPVVVFLEAETGIHASGDASVAPELRNQADNPAGVIGHVVAVPDGATRQQRAPVMRRGRPAAVLASHPQLAVVALPVAPGESHLIATGDKTPSAHQDRPLAAVRVDARPNPGTGLLLTAPTVEPRAVVAAVRGHDLATERSRGPWAVTGQRAAAAGVAAGTGAKRAGTSIATFFTRAGKALAQSF